MFYSNFIFFKKGPLSKVWLAAHWQRKLTKAHVNGTDIDVSAKTILDPNTPLALRLSGQLLLGLVRIYQKKVQYLQEDASDALTKIKIVFRPGTGVDLPPEPKGKRKDIDLKQRTGDIEFGIPDLGLDNLDALLLGDDQWMRRGGTGEPRLSTSDQALTVPHAQITLPEPEYKLDINIEEHMEMDQPQGDIDTILANLGQVEEKDESVEKPRAPEEAADESKGPEEPMEVDESKEGPPGRMSVDLVIPDNISVATDVSGGTKDTGIVAPPPAPVSDSDTTQTQEELDKKHKKPEEKPEEKPEKKPEEKPEEKKVPKKRKREEKPDPKTELQKRAIQAALKDTSDIVLESRETLIFSKKQKLRHSRRGRLNALLEEPGLGFHLFESQPYLNPPPLAPELRELYKTRMQTGPLLIPLKPKVAAELKASQELEAKKKKRSR